jgi:hypothetical protein
LPVDALAIDRAAFVIKLRGGFTRRCGIAGNNPRHLNTPGGV